MRFYIISIFQALTAVHFVLIKISLLYCHPSPTHTHTHKPSIKTLVMCRTTEAAEGKEGVELKAGDIKYGFVKNTNKKCI